ncbi:MAG: Serine/threonine protein kinase PrkC, regulator of stationary phase [Firmicutes bacterium]|nr:Serine/threonine protein kinase PrkC, regulator of stationary phase [Bacillota bacterium]
MEKYIGKLLDNRYELLDTIGVGGMAVVYKAYCHRLHRFVAVKILRRDLASGEEFRRRFHDEAQAVAMLSHPNIVSVYDVNRDEGLDYIVMELIDGITLKQYMKKKGQPLSWREALHYITQIMRALGHAHSRGIIHRDIKPQNIMVLRDGSVRVADFGIARVMSAAQNTLTQEALGSVHYISPEQARGSRIDERADIYSAGVVLYEMLTGRLPFEGDSPVSVAIQHINSIPLSPRELNPAIPEALEAITLKAMASKVERRYKNADEMIRDLEEFRKNPSVVFDYDHQKDLVVPVADEPTQVIDTNSVNNRRKMAAAPAAKPRLRTQSFDEDGYEDDDYNLMPAGRMRTNSKRALIPVISVISVFVIGVLVFLWVFFLSDLFIGKESIEVPNLLGMTIQEANESLNEEQLGWFEIQEAENREPSEDYPEGQIMAQDPKGASHVKWNDEKILITVTVSSGRDYVIMPDVVNQPYQEVFTLLRDMDLELDPPEYAYDDEITKGNVVSSLPMANEPLVSGTKIKLVISMGPEVQKVTMLSVKGLKEAEAKKIIVEDLGLVCKVEQVASDRPAGEVIYQSIPANSEIAKGTSVTIQVSTGPQTPPITDPNDPGDVKTKNIPITLPTDRETVLVKVTVDGVVRYESSVNTAINSEISPSIPGSGTQEVAIFFDGVLQTQYSVDFG